MKPTLQTRLLALALLLLCPAGLAAAEPSPAEISAWKGVGLTADAALPGPDGAPSIAVSPKAHAVLPLRTANDSGKVTFYVYDDGTLGVPGKARGVGPRWGIVQADGRVFVAGIMYAPRLEADGSLALMDVDPADRGAFMNLKYASARSPGRWQKWEFDFDPDTGLKLFIDDGLLSKQRFDWNLSKATGFTGLVLYGDMTDGAQTLHVSGIKYTLGGPMKVRPTGAAK